MHADPLPYFSALDEFTTKLASVAENPHAMSATEIEMIILSGALYIRKLDEHGFLKSSFAISGFTVNTHHGQFSMKDMCDRLLHSLLIDTQDLRAIRFRSDKEGDLRIDLPTLIDVFGRYARARRAA